MVDDPVEGGWVRHKKVPKPGNYARLEDLLTDLSPSCLEFFEKYRRMYFFDRFIPDQGMEETLDMLKRYGGQPRRWLDVGASVTTLFWSTAIDTKSTEQIDLCDIMPEALFVAKKFKESSEFPRCYEGALGYLRRNREVVEHARALPWTYHVFDCLSTWPNQMRHKSYDLITAIGILGLSPSADQYKAAFREICGNLTKGGVFIGVDWVRSDKFVEIDTHDNRYIDTCHIVSLKEKVALKLLSLNSVEIVGDENYCRLLVWAFLRPN